MKKTFYAGFQINSDEPIDERLYVADVTTAELQRIFGVDGRFGFPNSVVFDATSRKFWALDTYITKADVIVPSNWSAVGQNQIEFPLWDAGSAYGLGSCVTFTDSGNATKFYIGLGNILAGESPESNPSLWLNLSATVTSGTTAPYQAYYYHLDPRDPEGLATRSLIVDVDNVVSATGTQYPQIEIFGDFGDLVSANTVWEAIEPHYEFYLESGIIKCRITFTGDLSEFRYVIGDTSIKNVNIIFS